MSILFLLPCSTLLLFMGLTSIYTAIFNRSALTENHPQASPIVTAAIAGVMGTVITLIGYTLLSSALGL